MIIWRSSGNEKGRRSEKRKKRKKKVEHVGGERSKVYFAQLWKMPLLRHTTSRTRRHQFLLKAYSWSIQRPPDQLDPIPTTPTSYPTHDYNKRIKVLVVVAEQHLQCIGNTVPHRWRRPSNFICLFFGAYFPFFFIYVPQPPPFGSLLVPSYLYPTKRVPFLFVHIFSLFNL